ncbi:MAG TPA: hypothetical protein PKH22_03450 [Leptospiraceae bacterium]|nr:hypothetical protein [Leptospiraceae bacterium]
MKKYYLILFIILIGNCISIQKGEGKVKINTPAEEAYKCENKRGYYAPFLQCQKEYYVKQLTIREEYLKNSSSDSQNQEILQKLDEILERKDYKRALSISASIIKNSTDEDLKSRATDIAVRAYTELQMQDFNKAYPESKFTLKEK